MPTELVSEQDAVVVELLLGQDRLSVEAIAHALKLSIDQVESVAAVIRKRRLAGGPLEGDPSPEEIAARCRVIRSGWSAEEEASRRVGGGRGEIGLHVYDDHWLDDGEAEDSVR